MSSWVDRVNTRLSQVMQHPSSMIKLGQIWDIDYVKVPLHPLALEEFGVWWNVGGSRPLRETR